MMRRLRVVARVAPQVPALHLQICIIVNLGACCLQRSQQCSAVAERCAAARPVRKAHSGRTRDVASRRRALPARLTWYAIFVSLPNSTELLINCDATIARQCVRTPITAVIGYFRFRISSTIFSEPAGGCGMERGRSGHVRQASSATLAAAADRWNPRVNARTRFTAGPWVGRSRHQATPL
jgi:hypothetical protein